MNGRHSPYSLPGRGTSLSDATIRRQQIDYLLRQVPMMTGVSVINSVVVVLVLDGFSPRPAALLWAAAIIFPSLLNLLRALRSPSAGRDLRPISRRRMNRAAAWSAYMGLMWGLAGLVVFSPEDIVERTFLVLVVAGMAAGMVASLSPLPRHVIGFGAAALPPTVLMLATAGEVERGIAVLLVVFTIALGIATWNGYRRFVEMLMVKQELAEAKRLLEDAIESSGEAFALFDASGHPILVNGTFRRFFPEGRMPPEGAEEAIVERLKDGRWVQTTMRPTSTGGLVSVHADITALKRQEAELEAARYEAESANQAKSQFLAVMSHELRTPLNSIIGFSELLHRADSRLPLGTVREYARFVLDSGRHLKGLISDILDLSRIEAGSYPLQEEPVALEQIMREVACHLAPQADQAGVVLDVEAEAVEVSADVRAIRQILYNLVSNAIKFTDSCGRVTLAVRDAAEGVEIAISDTGIGIAEKDLPIIFEPFRQVENALSRKVEGTGLGLPLVKKLAELHGGSVQVSSTLGKGSRFVVRLPSERRVTARTAVEA